jgi:hypothetical protein
MSTFVVGVNNEGGCYLELREYLREFSSYRGVRSYCKKLNKKLNRKIISVFKNGVLWRIHDQVGIRERKKHNIKFQKGRQFITDGRPVEAWRYWFGPYPNLKDCNYA